MVRMILSLTEDDKRWLRAISREQRCSMAEAVRLSLRHFRQQTRTGGRRQTILQATAGGWRAAQGDAQAWVNRLRAEWDERP
jgi:hypothetical protein